MLSAHPQHSLAPRSGNLSLNEQLNERGETGAFLMRLLYASLLATTLLVPNAYAGEAVIPLAPGKPAGVQKAQALTSTAVLIGLGAGLTGLAIASIASNGKAGGCASGNPNTPCGSTSTSTTGTP